MDDAWGNEITDDCGHGFEIGVDLCPECDRLDKPDLAPYGSERTDAGAS